MAAAQHHNPLGFFDRAIAATLAHVRPAPLATAIKNLIGRGRLAVDTPNGKFWIDPLSMYGRDIARDGAYEPTMKSTIEAFLKPGDIFVDMGANEGYFTIQGARAVGPTGRVLAVEPQDRLIPVIEENLRLNNIGWTKVVNAAVSDKPGTATLHLSADINNTGSGLVNAARYRVDTQAVAARTLTQILDEAGIGTVDLMKVDIESYEWEMLLGASEAFRTHRIRQMALEIHGDLLLKRGIDPEEIVRKLDGFGYRILKPHSHWVWVA